MKSNRHVFALVMLAATAARAEFRPGEVWLDTAGKPIQAHSAGILVKGGGFGLIVDIIVGIVGAFIGGWLAGLLGISIGGGMISSIITAIIGAVILLFIIRLFRRA